MPLAFQLPVMSGLPSASRGVVVLAASVTAGGWIDGTCSVGVMAFLTLAGTGITT